MKIFATQQTVTKWQNMLCTHAVQGVQHCLHIYVHVHDAANEEVRLPAKVTLHKKITTMRKFLTVQLAFICGIHYILNLLEQNNE